jgi:hypothetical protein
LDFCILRFGSYPSHISSFDQFSEGNLHQNCIVEKYCFFAFLSATQVTYLDIAIERRHPPTTPGSGTNHAQRRGEPRQWRAEPRQWRAEPRQWRGWEYWIGFLRGR